MAKKRVKDDKDSTAFKVRFSYRTLILINLLVLVLIAGATAIFYHQQSMEKYSSQIHHEVETRITNEAGLKELLTPGPSGIFKPTFDYSFLTYFIVTLLLVSLIIGSLLAKTIDKPISSLTASINEINQGNLKTQLDTSNIKEVHTLSRSLKSILASLKLAVYKTGISEEELFGKLVEEKKTILNELKAKQGFINNMIETVGVSIIAFNNKDKLMFVNKDFLNITGYKLDDIDNFERWMALVFPGKLAKNRFKRALTKVTQGKKVKDFVIPAMCKNGMTSIFISNITAMKSLRNQITGHVISMRDISEIFELEKQIRYWAANGFTQIQRNPKSLKVIKRKSYIEISNPDNI